MSGHSKWKTIQHKKGALDAKRGKIFSKLSKEIMVVVKHGGPNPEMNATLRNIILKARSFNMPADNIDRAIKRGSGETDGVVMHEVVYECYAAGGVGVIVQVLTDNKNRAAAEIRHIFQKYGKDFATQGSVSRGFKRRGQILVDPAGVDEDKLMSIVLDAGAEDMQRDDGPFEILCDPATLSQVVKAIEDAGLKTASAEVALVPDTYVPIADKSAASQLLKFVNDLEDNDDVQNVYTNMDIGDEILAEIEKSG